MVLIPNALKLVAIGLVLGAVVGLVQMALH